MTMKTNLHYQSKLLSTSQIDQLKILLPELGFYSFKHSSELKKQIDENEPELNIVPLPVFFSGLDQIHRSN
jgi:hypothetical protein